MPSAPSSAGGGGDAGDDPALPRVGVAAAARRLGVAPATLRTWDRRYGIGPSEHLPGRHRRYSAEDMARLELMQHELVRGVSPAEAARYARAAPLPRPGGGSPARADVVAPSRTVTPPGGPGPSRPAAGPQAMPRARVGGRTLRLPSAGRAARGLGRAALALDGAAVRRSLDTAIATAGVERAWDEVARPVLAAVGQLWADTGAGVEIEHLLSECAIGAFGAYAAGRDPVSRRPVLLAAMPDEMHVVPLFALAATLADHGIGCRSLGSNLPADALVAAVRRTAPSALVLWSQLPATADVAVLAGLPRTRPRVRVFVAGPGWAAVSLPAMVERVASLTGARAEVAAAALA